MSELVLISIHPRFVDAILNGEKTIEFRRRWTTRPVSHLVIYATSPVKRIVAITTIKEVIQGSPTALWKLAREHGGGLARSELYAYFAGRASGIGLRLGGVKQLDNHFDPFQHIDGFRAPQSFRFLTQHERKVLNASS